MRAIAILALLVACNNDDVSRSVGARCDRVDDCDDRCLGPSPDYPDGFCSVDCTSSGDCPGDAECVEKDGGVCLFRCRETRDCEFLGPTWICKAEDLRGGAQTQVMVCRGE